MNFKDKTKEMCCLDSEKTHRENRRRETANSQPICWGIQKVKKGFSRRWICLRPESLCNRRDQPTTTVSRRSIDRKSQVQLSEPLELSWVWDREREREMRLMWLKWVCCEWMIGCVYIEEETSRLEVNGATLLVLTVIYNGQVPY